MADQETQSNDRVGDVAILVLGISPTGKSTLINWVLESFGVGATSTSVAVRAPGTMISRTSEVEAVPLHLLPDGRRVLLVDTPGFDHTVIPDGDVFLEIADWLENSYKAGTRVGAVLYLHDICQDQITRAMDLQMKVLPMICGDEVIANGALTIVSTRWSMGKFGVCKKREARLFKDPRLKFGCDHPLSAVRVKNQDAAKKLIEDLIPRLRATNVRTALSIQHELVEERRLPEETTAGACFDLRGRDTDIIILVVGPTKVGKSTVLNSLLHAEKFAVGRKLASCTSNVSSRAVLRAPRECSSLNQALGGHRIILVDTPGFDDTTMGEAERVIGLISKWLTTSYKGAKLATGVVYLHDISRDEGPPPTSLASLVTLCGGNAMEMIRLVTTKWDRLREPVDGAERVKELRNTFWKKALMQGASVLHLRPHGPSGQLLPEHKRPWEIIETIVLSALAGKN